LTQNFCFHDLPADQTLKFRDLRECLAQF
jgi:hypothetical protein